MQITINNQSLPFKKGETIIEIAKKNDIEIPYYCWHKHLSVAANCRMCLVEVEGINKLLPSCQTTCNENMIVHTENERVKGAQKAVNEFLLINHPIDCPICDQAGECKLQNYYMKYQLGSSPMNDKKVSKPRLEILGDTILYNAERCIMCTRCVRFMDEVAQDRQLGIFNRGDHTVIGTMPGKKLDSPYSLNTVDVCPVGALTSRVFRFKQRVWNLKRQESICMGCSRGCNTYIDHRADQIYRLLPRDNNEVNQSWMCDEGRMTYKHANENRLKECLIRDDKKNELKSVSSDSALKKITELLKPFCEQKNTGIACILTPHATCEEAYVVGRFIKEILKPNKVAISGYQNWEEDNILRKADQNPNRYGTLKVLEDLNIPIIDIDHLYQLISTNDIHTVFMLGHEVIDTDQTISIFKNLQTFIHITYSQSPLTDIADVSLPATCFSEVNGTWINFSHRLQRLNKAYTPPFSAFSYHHWIGELASLLSEGFALPSTATIQLEMMNTLPSFKNISLNKLDILGEVI